MLCSGARGEAEESRTSHRQGKAQAQDTGTAAHPHRRPWRGGGGEGECRAMPPRRRLGERAGAGARAGAARKSMASMGFDDPEPEPEAAFGDCVLGQGEGQGQGPGQQQGQQPEAELGAISVADIQGVSIRDCTVQFKGVVIKISPDTLLRFMPGFQPGTVPFEEAACFHSRDFFIQHHSALPAANKQVKLNSITPKKLRDLCKQRYQFFYERSNQSKVPWKFLSVVYAEYAGTPVDWADAMCKRIMHAFDGVLTGKLRKFHNEKLILAYLSHMASSKHGHHDFSIAHIDDLLELELDEYELNFDCFLSLPGPLDLEADHSDAASAFAYAGASPDNHFFLNV